MVVVKEDSGGIWGAGRRVGTSLLVWRTLEWEVFAWIWDWLANCYRQSSTPFSPPGSHVFLGLPWNTFLFLNSVLASLQLCTR